MHDLILSNSYSVRKENQFNLSNWSSGTGSYSAEGFVTYI